MKPLNANTDFIFTRQRLNLSRNRDKQNSDIESEINLIGWKDQNSNQYINMVDLMSKICKKSTFFIAITILCVGALVAAIVVSIVIKRETDPFSCVPESSKTACETEKLYRFYGTKTDYLEGRGPLPENKITRSGCETLQLYLISRHATRYPGKDNIEEMSSTLNDIKEQIVKSATAKKIELCNKIVDELNGWKLKMDPEDDNRISDSGKNISTNLGRRLKLQFPTLFTGEYIQDNYQFGYTSKNRTSETANAFASGIFDGHHNLPHDGNMDSILSFHKECDKELKKHTNWKKSKPEQELLFLNSTAFKRTINDINNRLNLNITMDTAKIMLKMCQFEYSIDGYSPWCPLFTESNVKVFEYLEDLNDYYSDGYGVERNHKQACPLMADILSQFNLTMQDNDQHLKAALRFSHAGAVKKVAAHLGLFKDNSDLMANDFCQNGARKWQSSHICPFNANFYAVLYKCPNKQYNVETYYNEKLVTVEGCTSEFCPWDEFLNQYGASSNSDNCKLNEICKP